MPSVHSLAKLCTRCPYCDHVSPEHSKFCNDCGAALHLRPCPHCGALNDLTLGGACGRCGGDMQADEAPEPANASTFDPAPADVQDPPALAAAAPARLLSGLWPVLALLLVAGSASAYYLLGARPGVGAAPTPAAPTPAAPALVPVSNSLAMPASAAEPAAAIAEGSAVPGPAASAPPLPVRRAKPGGRMALPAQWPTEPSSAGRAAAPRPENQSSPCTEAVAALGLCSLPEAKAPR